VKNLKKMAYRMVILIFNSFSEESLLNVLDVQQHYIHAYQSS